MTVSDDATDGALADCGDRDGDSEALTDGLDEGDTEQFAPTPVRNIVVRLSGGVAAAFLTLTFQLQRASSGALKLRVSAASIWQEGATRESSTLAVNARDGVETDDAQLPQLLDNATM